MPNLTKTTTVPTQDPTLVLNLPILKMIVLGNRSVIAQLADDLAQDPPIVDRQVIWFTAGLPDNYKKQFNISDPLNLITNLLNVQAFSLSTGNKIADAINISENVDEVRMDLAYTNAGK